jgi:light-regulated signal transduction histidine kinase (bacteriophytochrome)
MVYRFDAQESGEVVAEAVRHGVESFLGLHYPASDIPAQARQLYLRNTFRVIADVGAVPVPLVPGRDPAGQVLDQSLCVLRAVSPIHIEYLHNMGVRASLSISIVVGASSGACLPAITMPRACPRWPRAARPNCSGRCSR